MKKLFFILAAAAGILVSCTKNEVAPAGPQEITYMTAPVVKATAFDTGHKFVSYAYLLTDGKNWEGNQSASTPYIENKLIQYHAGTPAKWAHETEVYYWPKDEGSKLTFFAWADNTATPNAAGKNIPSCSNTTGVKFIDFDITNTYDKNRDIQVAKIAADQKENTTAAGSWADGVPTVFQHILSKIDTKIKLDKAYGSAAAFNLKSINLLSVDTKNTYTQGVDATTEPKAAGWGTPTVPANLNVFSGDMVVNSIADQDISENGYYILMPQTFTAGTEKIQIVYEVTTNYAGTPVTETVTVTKDLSAIYTSNWVAGSAYTLTITLGLNEILWDPAVEVWDTGTDGSWNIN